MAIVWEWMLCAVNTLFLIVSLALALAGAHIAGGVYYWWSSRQALSRSLAEVLESRLGMSYEIRSASLSMETDMNGSWWLRLSSASVVNRLQSGNSGFARADAADLAESMRAFEETASSSGSLQGAELYKAEFPLGNGTICEALPCNVEILASPIGDSAFVRISKN